VKNLKRTQNKLLRSGFMPESQGSEYEYWIDVTNHGTAISFRVKGLHVVGRLKVHGRRPDEPEHDIWYSTWASNVKEAIELARV
jgi:hypothetical protein